MNNANIYKYVMIIFALLVLYSTASAQLEMTVNSLADDENAYAYDDPNTPVDESMDGKCGDALGRCTLRAAIEESSNLNLPLVLGFSVTGTINLTDGLYPVSGSVINGARKIKITAPPYTNCFELEDNTEVSGILFNNVFTAIYTWGNHNKIGGVFNGNVFTNCYIAVEIDGDSNEVISNYFGIDTNKVLQPNTVSIMVFGSQNNIGRSVATFSNTICGSSSAGISLTEGGNNQIKNNFIGTTSGGDLGLGNIQGILIAGSTYNTIGGDNSADRNVISGNSIDGINVSGVPPDNNSETFIKNNIIGLDASQSTAIPNGRGITFTNGVWGSTISGNVVAGNYQDGINIFGYDTDSRNSLLYIDNNWVGVNSNGKIFPNGGNGILLSGNVDHVNIGTDEGGSFLPNIIAGNSGSGINIQTNFNFSPSRIVFRKNKIYQNSTSNLFVSSQANNGIKTPYNITYSNNTIAGIHDITGAIIDFYKANINESSPSAYAWLGSTTVGSNGVFSFEITDPSVEAVSLTATNNTGNTSGFASVDLITDVKNKGNEIPTKYSLSQNYPNPFNPSTIIKYSIPNFNNSFLSKAAIGLVTLKIYDLLGREITTLVNEEKSPGNYKIAWNAAGVPSGIYFYQLRSNNFVSTRKMILMK